RDVYKRQELDGAPNFDEENAYPRDIHASTQGILVFTKEGELELAERILRWVLANLQVEGEQGRYYYRKYRHHTKRVTLMRWCQGWMAYAMSEFLLAVANADTDAGTVVNSIESSTTEAEAQALARPTTDGGRPPDETTGDCNGETDPQS
ncbi:hypothetical protein C482_10306, partial [Natrialba chahannaoensis JCM 10990]